ncbi:hypothetical protein EBZ80_15210 [bacterium]|nr:hypothetical protein [Betaproteobacteria bacterium]NDE16273.1 hypothetical protein [bacterium]
MRNNFTDEKPAAPDAVTLSEISAMLTGMLQHNSLLRESLRVGLDHKHFGQSVDELPYYYLFAAMQDLYKQYGSLTATIVINRLLAWRDSNSMALGEDGVNELTAFIEAAFAAQPAETEPGRAEKAYIEDIARRFIRERMIKGEVQAAMNTSIGAPDNLEAQLAQWTKRAQSVEYIGRSFEHAAMMPEFGQEILLPPPAVPTTLPFIDNYITGFRSGDIHGVLGPFGGGKTTILAVTAVRLAHQYSVTNPNKLSVFVGYEDPAHKMNPLFWSAAAQIDRSLFRGEVQFWDQLSTASNLKDYDRELPQNRNGEVMFGERERWDASRGWVNSNFHYLDFSQNALTGNRGSGGVSEIMIALEQLAEERGMEIGFVAIDYCGIMVERELGMSTRGQYMDQIARPIKNAVDQLRTKIAVPTGCVIMLAHQLATGDVKHIPTYRYVSHADAAGSKSFAENLHGCLCVNKQDEVTRVSTIYWSKTRYVRPDNLKGLIKFHDKVAEIQLVNDEYTVSEAAKRIIQRGDIGPVDPAQAAALERPRANVRRVIPVDNYAEDMMS